MSSVYVSSVDADRPGVFSENLSKLLHANKLPNFSTADIEPPNMTAQFSRATEEILQAIATLILFNLPAMKM